MSRISTEFSSDRDPGKVDILHSTPTYCGFEKLRWRFSRVLEGGFQLMLLNYPAMRFDILSETQRPSEQNGIV
eukprot:6103106-Amphidinium_carterae.1